MSGDSSIASDFTLKDGQRAQLRPIRPDDAPRLIALFNRLSDETIRYRFFIAKKELLPHEAAHFANVDYHQRMAVVAECQPTDEIELIGVARYDATQTPTPALRRAGASLSRSAGEGVRAEFAIVVEDRFQGQGLGKTLLRALAAAARAHAIRYLAGDTLADNQNMLRFLRSCGYAVKFRRRGSEMHFVLDIGAKA